MSDKKLSLYGGTSELSYIENLLENSNGTIDEVAIAEKMNQLTVFLQEKTDSVSGYQRSLDNDIAECEYVIKEYTAHKRSLEKKQDTFEKYILTCLDSIGVKKLVGKIYTISYRSPSKVVEILDANKIDVQYTRTSNPQPVTEIDKNAIKEAFAAGIEVEGARVIDGKRSLNFKAGK